MDMERIREGLYYCLSRIEGERSFCILTNGLSKDEIEVFVGGVNDIRLKIEKALKSGDGVYGGFGLRFSSILVLGFIGFDGLLGDVEGYSIRGKDYIFKGYIEKNDFLRMVGMSCS